MLQLYVPFKVSFSLETEMVRITRIYHELYVS